MLRYTLLRLLIFFGCLSLLWLLGLRDDDELPWLVVGGAILSMVVAAVVLRPMREEYIAEMTQRIERRRAAKSGQVTDEDVEDADVDRRRADDAGDAGDEPETFR